MKYYILNLNKEIFIGELIINYGSNPAFLFVRMVLNKVATIRNCIFNNQDGTVLQIQTLRPVFLIKTNNEAIFSLLAANCEFESESMDAINNYLNQPD